MRRLAAICVLSALATPIGAQRPAIRWESTGGPLVVQQKEIISQKGRLLLVPSYGGWWRSPDGGVSWQPHEERTPRPWILAANDRFVFGDTADAVVRSSDMGESWTACGALPVTRQKGNAVTSIATADNRVYVSVYRIGFFRSDDQCTTWVMLDTPWKGEFPPKIRYANRSRVVVLAVGGFFLSNNAGASWTLLPLRDPLAFTTACNGRILAGTSRGAFASRDNGRSWVSIGLEGRWVADLGTPRCDEMFAVVQDAGRWTYSVFRSTDGGDRWTLTNTGLTGHWIGSLTADDRGAVYAVGTSGAYRWSHDEWKQIGPASTTVTGVVGAIWGDLFAAADSMGLFRATGPAQLWQRLLYDPEAQTRLHGPLYEPKAHVITITPNGVLLAATQLGVLRSHDRGQTWRRAGLLRPVNVFATTESGSMVAGTGNGIFRSVDGEKWIERSIGLSSFRVASLAVGADGTLYAGTMEGEVFRSTDEGDQWRPMGTPRGRSPVNALVALRNGDLLAGGHGLVRWDGNRRSWQSIVFLAERRPFLVRALIQDERGWVFAGTEADGMFASFDGGKDWQEANDGLTAERVFSFGTDSHGRIVAGTSAGVFRALEVE